MSAIKERPILFSGPMVRAILDGRKTVTRRAVKGLQIPKEDPSMGETRHRWSAVGQRDPRYGFCVFGETEEACAMELGEFGACPYGHRGDRLWVREAWSDVNMCGAPALAYRADEDVRDLMGEELFLDDDGAFNYQDKRWNKYPFCDWYADLHLVRWRPSIHMPRWACRILLEITSVRVERLQDISGDQAEAEGVDSAMCRQFLETSPSRHECKEAVIHGFAGLWASLNGDDSWHANPWVWVVEFKRIEQ
ncbi:hypothetical protein BVH03_08550 [Pseudomonas sp. PA15(2017)]|uniref:hypothetical protein n=1 Tax=Pseudomonas sp. PA15(2017) TaxID=1932111 RepID=UPI0009670B41|nr:hypothetical protein [Pseudomonas sp. PA15(2017)]OLU31511.1 hypothetical protein BVH03_08550 [Pseudomonas sp. PA15(2017)]